MIDGDIMDSPTQVGLGCGMIFWRPQEILCESGIRPSGLATTPGCSVAVEDARRKLEFADEKLERHGKTITVTVDTVDILLQ